MATLGMPGPRACARAPEGEPAHCTLPTAFVDPLAAVASLQGPCLRPSKGDWVRVRFDIPQGVKGTAPATTKHWRVPCPAPRVAQGRAWHPTRRLPLENPRARHPRAQIALTPRRRRESATSLARPARRACAWGKAAYGVRFAKGPLGRPWVVYLAACRLARPNARTQSVDAIPSGSRLRCVQQRLRAQAGWGVAVAGVCENRAKSARRRANLRPRRPGPLAPVGSPPPTALAATAACRRPAVAAGCRPVLYSKN